MENSTKILIGAGIVTAIGITLYLTKDKWLPLLQGEKGTAGDSAATTGGTASRGGTKLGGAAKFDFGDKGKKTADALKNIGKSLATNAADITKSDKLKSPDSSDRATSKGGSIKDIAMRVNATLKTGSAPSSADFKNAVKKLKENGYELKGGQMVKIA